MADLEIRVPASLGLSEEQIRKLTENLQDTLVDILRGTPAEAIVEAKPQTIEKSEIVRVKSKSQVV